MTSLRSRISRIESRLAEAMAKDRETLRLGLERADTAEAAVTVMTDLLTEYGQGGNCGHTHNFSARNMGVPIVRSL